MSDPIQTLQNNYKDELIITQRKLIEMQENEIVYLKHKMNTIHDDFQTLEDELERAKNYISSICHNIQRTEET
jgi:uncharacterized protein YpuA (DUF1002 family)